MIKIIVAGGSGLVGRYLCPFLVSKGFDVLVLSRSVSKVAINLNYDIWDPSNGKINSDIFTDGCHIINLCGENIGKSRWTTSRKADLLRSRIDSNTTLLKGLQASGKRAGSIISISAIGYYGTAGSLNEVFSEVDDSGIEFLGNLCAQWEKSSMQLNNFSTNHYIMRLGLVLTNSDGVLESIVKPIKRLVGLPIGTGQQVLSWIHIFDLLNWFYFVLQSTPESGIYNVVASNNSNLDFTKQICQQLNRVFIGVSLPKLLFNIFLGEMACLVTEGVQVSNKKMVNSGFELKFRKLDSALQDLL